MNGKTVGIRVPAKVLFEAFKIACTGVIHVQLLMGEQIDGNRRFIDSAEKIEQDEEPSMMYADLGHPSMHLGAVLRIGKEDNGLRRSR